MDPIKLNSLYASKLRLEKEESLKHEYSFLQHGRWTDVIRRRIERSFERQALVRGKVKEIHLGCISFGRWVLTVEWENER